jgi:hypothetical protein
MPHHTRLRCTTRSPRLPHGTHSGQRQIGPHPERTSTMFEVANLVAAHEVDNAFPQPRGRVD